VMTNRCALSLFSVLCLLLVACGIATAEAFTGLVVGVSDSDTITVLDEHHYQHKIRLAGIDAPEKRQDFGNRAKQSLSDLAYRRQANVETGKTDRYGRQVGKVIVNGMDVNLEQVRRGMAWHYKAYKREQSVADRQAYAGAEDTARVARKGLWALPSPVAPWEFRKTRKAAASALVRP
jgi:endonuclease YncB( thermonuclease family)